VKGGLILEPKTKRIALVTLFGGVVFLSKIVVPSPLDKMFIGVHALLLALGGLLLKRLGATYVAVVGGFLTALWRISFAPFTFVFDLLYGLFVDSFFLLFKANVGEGTVNNSRVVVSTTVSTALVGLISYYLTVFQFGLLERNPVLELGMLFAGALNGLVAGYFTCVIWNKHLKNVGF
jgi:hypothetical protein